MANCRISLYTIAKDSFKGRYALTHRSGAPSLIARIYLVILDISNADASTNTVSAPMLRYTRFVLQSAKYSISRSATPSTWIRDFSANFAFFTSKTGI